MKVSKIKEIIEKILDDKFKESFRKRILSTVSQVN